MNNDVSSLYETQTSNFINSNKDRHGIVTPNYYFAKIVKFEDKFNLEIEVDENVFQDVLDINQEEEEENKSCFDNLEWLLTPTIAKIKQDDLEFEKEMERMTKECCG